MANLNALQCAINYYQSMNRDCASSTDFKNCVNNIVSSQSMGNLINQCMSGGGGGGGGGGGYDDGGSGGGGSIYTPTGQQTNTDLSMCGIDLSKRVGGDAQMLQCLANDTRMPIVQDSCKYAGMACAQTQNKQNCLANDQRMPEVNAYLDAMLNDCAQQQQPGPGPERGSFYDCRRPLQPKEDLSLAGTPWVYCDSTNTGTCLPLQNCPPGASSTGLPKSYYLYESVDNCNASCSNMGNCGPGTECFQDAPVDDGGLPYV